MLAVGALMLSRHKREKETGSRAWVCRVPRHPLLPRTMHIMLTSQIVARTEHRKRATRKFQRLTKNATAYASHERETENTHHALAILRES